MDKKLQQEAIQREPLLEGEGSRILSLRDFAKQCKVLRSPTTQTITVNMLGEVKWRRYVMLFGRDNEGKWKYWARIYAPSKRRALERFYNGVCASALGEEPSDIPQGDIFLEGFIAGYDRRIPLSF